MEFFSFWINLVNYFVYFICFLSTFWFTFFSDLINFLTLKITYKTKIRNPETIRNPILGLIPSALLCGNSKALFGWIQGACSAVWD